MPAWLEKIVIEMIMKFLTPEMLKKIEDEAKVFVIGELRKLAALSPTDIDDQLVEKLAQLLGVPLTA